MRWAALLVVLTACWTGDVPEPAQPAVQPASPAVRMPHTLYTVKMTRTTCFGRCPAYTVEIDREGHVRWLGSSSVAEIGPRSRDVSRSDVRRLARAIDKVGFFALDETGTDVCKDTSHARITVTGESRQHSVLDAHCTYNRQLDELEHLIDTVAGTREWIGR